MLHNSQNVNRTRRQQIQTQKARFYYLAFVFYEKSTTSVIGLPKKILKKDFLGRGRVTITTSFGDRQNGGEKSTLTSAPQFSKR